MKQVTKEIALDTLKEFLKDSQLDSPENLSTLSNFIESFLKHEMRYNDIESKIVVKDNRLYITRKIENYTQPLELKISNDQLITLEYPHYDMTFAISATIEKFVGAEKFGVNPFLLSVKQALQEIAKLPTKYDM